MMTKPRACDITIDDWLRGALGRSNSRDELPKRRLGDLELAPFQQRAATRLVEIIQMWGGALLADVVGMGKTRIALACAMLLQRAQKETARRVGIVAPARVISQWESHISRARLSSPITILSHASLSRGETIPPDLGLLIIDEAHRFRNPRARRTAELRRASAHTPVLLVTATPIARSLNDLRHLLELFVNDTDARAALGLGLSDAFDRACDERFDLTELLQHVCVRRESGSISGTDRRPGTRLNVLEYEPEADEAWLWTELEPRLTRLHGDLLNLDWPRGLMIEHILRRWESGAEALFQSLISLVEFHERWLEEAARGRHLSRAEFRALFGEAPEQGIFPFMFEASERPRACPERVEEDLLSLREIASSARRATQCAGGLDRAVADLARDGRKLLIFTSFRSAAQGLYERLRDLLGADARIGLVTGSGAWATGLGRTGSDDVLSRFAPISRGLELPPHQTIQVLVATDCISEGVDLQDCGHIVLADLPYTPLAVEQRIGRLLRPGNPHGEVVVYLPRPVSWNDSLGLRRRLRSRLKDASNAGLDYQSLRGTELDDQPCPKPFAVLAAHDALRASIESGREVVGDYRAGSRAKRALAHVRIRANDLVHEAFITADQDSKHASWSALDALLYIQRLRDIEPNLAPCTPEPSLRQKIEQALSERLELLLAALFAPAHLPFNSPQVRAWKTIRGLDLSSKELDFIRPKLLASMTSGRVMRLERLLENSHDRGLLDFVQTLPTPPPTPRVEGQIITYLEAD